MAIIDLDKALSDVYGFGKEKVNTYINKETQLFNLINGKF